MSLRRSISWSSALLSLRADRAQISPTERGAALAANGFAKLAAVRAQASTRSNPLFVAGAYSRRAIMSVAIVSAKARRSVTGEPWNICLSAALKGTWQAAKTARRLAHYLEQHEAHRDGNAQSRSVARSMSAAEGQGAPTFSEHAPSTQTSLRRPQQSPKLRRSDGWAGRPHCRPAEPVSPVPAPR